MGNVLALERFFTDKEVVYQRESVRCVMVQLEFNLKTAIAYSSKEEFGRIIGIIDGRDDEELCLIGWKKTGWRWKFLHNYRLMRLDWLKKKTIRFVKKRLGCKNF